MEVPDFSGYATKAGLKCSDGRTIMPEAFKHQDQVTVPLVWQHGHDDPDNILGKAVLEHRSDGVYARCYFNGSPKAQSAKMAVQHGDVNSLSIYANKLVEKSKQVMHGFIREVSLVISGANPGAFIDNVNLQHADGSIEELDDAAIMYTGIEGLDLEHADDDDNEGDDVATQDTNQKTVQQVYDSLNEEQKNVLHYFVGEALKSAGEDDSSAEHSDNSNSITHQEDNDMTRNLFEQNGDAVQHNDEGGPTLTHSQLLDIAADAKKRGSWKEAILAHAEEYGITNIETLFPDATQVNNTPEWITRRMEWVAPVLNGARHLPFARFKSRSADLTHEEARAKGYIKGNMKKEQFFEISGRETTPTTIYKKQKLDRDDIIDITDFNVVDWIWQEMRFMLNEEIARAILIGDGREVDDEDKIPETKIRPIARDDEFYTDRVIVPANVSASSLIEQVIRARENYKGSGEPTAFMTRSVLNDMLLLKDKMGRRLYRNKAELASELEVRDIIVVPILEDATTEDGDLLMILVNLADYSIGTDKGGRITTFEDFDIDFNQHKYLIEGRMSGALTSHKSAQVVVRASGATVVTPQVPTFNPTTGVITIPNQTGVLYFMDDEELEAGAQDAIAAGTTVEVEARPDTGYAFPHNTDADWEFTRPE